MKNSRQFPVTFVLVLVLHIAVIALIFRALVLNSDAQSSQSAAPPPATKVNWIDTNPAIAQAAVTPPPITPQQRLPYASSSSPADDPESQIALPTRPPESVPAPEPEPPSQPVVKPESKPEPKAPPKLSAAPTPAPKPTPKPSPKPAPVLAPAPSPKPPAPPETQVTLKPDP
jgi:outer membrane biosynthesis protein TonB